MMRGDFCRHHRTERRRQRHRLLTVINGLTRVHSGTVSIMGELATHDFAAAPVASVYVAQQERVDPRGAYLLP